MAGAMSAAQANAMKLAIVVRAFDQQYSKPIIGVFYQVVAGCARNRASSISVPQPGPAGSTNAPFSIVNGLVSSLGFQGTSSTSNSMMRKLGTTEAKCAEITADRGPLKLCEAILTS